MKSLARRGFEYSNREGCSDTFRAGLERGYWDGATEQRDIDINKAAEWLNANWRKYIDTDADGMIRFAGWKNDFITTMLEDEND